ncbi:hypothetical protein CsSME_00032200 [Camellia sinensis var. sinensis]
MQQNRVKVRKHYLLQHQNTEFHAWKSLQTLLLIAMRGSWLVSMSKMLVRNSTCDFFSRKKKRGLVQIVFCGSSCRKVKGSDSSLDGCGYHLVCPCCTLCQESRTLEMNNVQDGTWHGRGDTICIGGYGEGNKSFFQLRPPPIMSAESPDPCSMPESINVDEHSWTTEVGHSVPLVAPSQY